jgi:hypothetical protein
MIQLLLIYNKVIHVLLVEVFYLVRVKVAFFLVVGDLINMFLDY